jgi:hypothetical protein
MKDEEASTMRDVLNCRVESYAENVKEQDK